MDIYEDSVLQRVVATTALPAGNTRDIEFGRSWGGGTPIRYFHGLLDEVAYYGRALSAGEISAIYNAGPAGKFLASPLMAVHPTSTNTILVLWPSPSIGFALEQSLMLGASNWTNVPATPADDGTRKSVSVPLDSGTSFFRLKK